MSKPYRFILCILTAGALGIAACSDSPAPVSTDKATPESSTPLDLGTLERLMQRSESRTLEGTAAPSFVVDPSWPKPLPNDWLIGQVGGLTVDSQDNVWVYHRGRTLAQSSAYALGVSGTDENGTPVDALGHSRSLADQIAGCCIVAPSVLKFDSEGNLLDAWGGPQDPGFLEKNVSNKKAVSGRAESTAFTLTTMVLYMYLVMELTSPANSPGQLPSATTLTSSSLALPASLFIRLAMRAWKYPTAKISTADQMAHLSPI